MSTCIAARPWPILILIPFPHQIFLKHTQLRHTVAPVFELANLSTCSKELAENKTRKAAGFDFEALTSLESDVFLLLAGLLFFPSKSSLLSPPGIASVAPPHLFEVVHGGCSIFPAQLLSATAQPFFKKKV